MDAEQLDMAGGDTFGARTVLTDRLDALRLARLFRAGELTPIWVPDEVVSQTFCLTFAVSTFSLCPLRHCSRMSEGGVIRFKGSHYPKHVILYAVYFYVRYAVSYRDLEEILAERGVHIDHATLNRWVVKYAPLIAAEAQKQKSADRGVWMKPTSR